MAEQLDLHIEPGPGPRVPTIEERMRTLVMLIAENIRPCRACGKQIAFIRHRSGKVGPYTMDGINHFIDCPKAEEFKQLARKDGLS